MSITTLSNGALPALAARRNTLRRIAQVCLALIILIVLLSAFMRHDGAGLGCAPWPACYGQDPQAAPAPQAGAASDGVALARLAHRVVASLALVLILAMLLACLATRPALRRETALATSLLTLALALAVLGVFTPGSRVPAVTLGNLLGGFFMLALCVRMIAVAGATERPRDAMLSRMAALAVILLVLQVAMGALVSATHAGLSCRSLAECLELAGGGGWDLAAFDPWREAAPGSAGAANPLAGAPVQLAHRVGAIVTSVAVAILGLLAWWRGRRGDALVLAGLLFGVLVLGVVIGEGALPLPAVLLHNLAAACLLAVAARLA